MTEQQLGPVVIGPREIYDQLVKLTLAVGEVRGELARMGDAQQNAQARLNDHAGRLHQVERRLWAIPSASLLVSIAAVAVAIVAIL